MDVINLLSTVAILSSTVVSPLSSDFQEPIPPVTFDHIEVNLAVPVTPTPTPQTQPTPTPIPPTPTRTNTPTPKHKTAKKNNVKIALIGDSMTDTLGPTITELTDELKKTYPEISPLIYNYGVGGTNIDYGIERITHDYEYLGQKIPSLASIQPDIVVLESFGYNPYPFDTGAIDRHWMQLAAAVDLLRQSVPHVKIVIAATIAPNSTTFGDGKLGYSLEEKRRKVQTIKQYLESTIKFAKGQHIPLADAYHPSLLSNAEGNQKYINGGDNIHPSDEGRKFFAQIVAHAIMNANYLD